MLVVYTGNNNETIITTTKREHEMLKEYFGPDMDRDVEDYDREVAGKQASAVTFSSEIKRDW